MTGSAAINLSIIVPTYGREQVLVDTLNLLIDLKGHDIEIIVVDQTPEHEPDVDARLTDWNTEGEILWCRLPKPSITAAMNRGAMKAGGQVLLYLDDDVIPDSDLLGAHIRTHRQQLAAIVAGRVLQPWHTDAEEQEPFTGRAGHFGSEFIGCNFSVARSALLTSGGFDENFRGAAYNYEREFSDRLLAAGHRIWYEPSALIRHLHHASGGTRSKGSHLTSWSPRHPVGAYYYLLVSPRVRHRAAIAARRFVRSVMTRHHLRKPWYIPVTLVSEGLGLCWALWLRLQGPALPFQKRNDEAHET